MYEDTVSIIIQHELPAVHGGGLWSVDRWGGTYNLNVPHMFLAEKLRLLLVIKYGILCGTFHKVP